MDVVADALIRIKNGYMAYKTDVVLTYSKLNLAICALLQKEGFITEAKQEKTDVGSLKAIKVILKYVNKKPAIMGVTRVSKPGLRIYKGKNSLPYVLNGLGIAIISTPKGVMSDKQARKEGLGGEIM